MIRNMAAWDLELFNMLSIPLFLCIFIWNLNTIFCYFKSVRFAHKLLCSSDLWASSLRSLACHSLFEHTLALAYIFNKSNASGSLLSCCEIQKSLSLIFEFYFYCINWIFICHWIVFYWIFINFISSHNFIFVFHIHPLNFLFNCLTSILLKSIST